MALLAVGTWSSAVCPSATSFLAGSVKQMLVGSESFVVAKWLLEITFKTRDLLKKYIGKISYVTYFFYVLWDKCSDCQERQRLLTFLWEKGKTVALYRDSYSKSHRGSSHHNILAPDQLSHKWIRIQLGDQCVCVFSWLAGKSCENAFHIGPDLLLVFWVSVERLIAEHVGRRYFFLSVACEHLTSAQKLLACVQN